MFLASNFSFFFFRLPQPKVEMPANLTMSIDDENPAVKPKAVWNGGRDLLVKPEVEFRTTVCTFFKCL
jgi:hypothetical protein